MRPKKTPAPTTFPDGVAEADRTQKFLGCPLSHWPLVACFLVALVANLAVRGVSYWCLDDWGLLAKADGLLPSPTFQARFFSQIVYWKLLYPLAGLAPEPYTWSRIILHASSVALLVRIAARGGWGASQQFLAGLIFASTPLVFVPLYWASGVQELLGAFFGLFAVERWLAGGRVNFWLSMLCGVLAILSKENVLGLPVLLGALLLAGAVPIIGRHRLAWLAVAGLTVVSAGEGILILRHFSSVPGDPYAFGPWYSPVLNLAVFGLWLLLPGPYPVYNFPLVMYLAGLLFWILWGYFALNRWRVKDRRVAFCLAAAFLSLLPVLSLRDHLYPYYAYVAASALAMTVAAAVPHRWRIDPVVAALLGFFAVAWGLGVASTRQYGLDSQGLPRENTLKYAVVARDGIATLQNMRVPPGGAIVVYQIPTPAPAAGPDVLGRPTVPGTSLVRRCLGEGLGPRLILGQEVEVAWTDDLQSVNAGSYVAADTGWRLLPWDSLDHGLLYASLVAIAEERFGQAVLYLSRALEVSQQRLTFRYDASLLPVSFERVQELAPRFEDYLTGEVGRPPAPILSADEVRKIVQVFRVMLAKCREQSTGFP